MSLRLANDTVELVLAPELGGSVLRFRWCGRDVLRDSMGARTVLETASFPLVPFAGRIAGSRFPWGGRTIELTPLFPGEASPQHAIHGHGWLAPWHVARTDEACAELAFDAPPDDWPWPYRAVQRFTLTPVGFVQEIEVTNLSGEPMPSGIGIHPYFPRDADAVLRAAHRSEWRTDGAGLMLEEDLRPQALDWWGDAPAGARNVDTAYGHREGAISLIWPARDVALEIAPDARLAHTVIYVPPGEDFFCVEPVSHVPNAHNRAEEGLQGLVALAPGETIAAAIGFHAGPARS